MTADSETVVTSPAVTARSVEDAIMDDVFSAVAGKSDAISSTVFRKAVASSETLSRDLGNGARCLADIAFQQTVCQSPASRKLLRRHFPSVLHALAYRAPNVCALEVAMGLLHPTKATMCSATSPLGQDDHNIFNQRYHSPEVQSVMSNQAQFLREVVFRPHFGETCESSNEFLSLIHALQDKRILPILPNSIFGEILDHREDSSLTFRVFLKCFALASMCRVSRVSACTASQLSKQILATMRSLRDYYDHISDLSDVSTSSTSVKSQACSSSSHMSRDGRQSNDLHSSKHTGSVASSYLRRSRSRSRSSGRSKSAEPTRPSCIDISCDDQSGSIDSLMLVGGMNCRVHNEIDERISYHCQPSPSATVSRYQERTGTRLSSSRVSVRESSSQIGEDRTIAFERSKVPILLQLIIWMSGVGIAVIVSLVALDMFGLLDGLSYHPDVFEDMMI